MHDVDNRAKQRVARTCMSQLLSITGRFYIIHYFILRNNNNVGVERKVKRGFINFIRTVNGNYIRASR